MAKTVKVAKSYFLVYYIAFPHDTAQLYLLDHERGRGSNMCPICAQRRTHMKNSFTFHSSKIDGVKVAARVEKLV